MKRVKPNKIIGQNVRAIRKVAKFSQAELGRVLKVHQTAVCRIERGTQNLTPEQIIRFCRTFDCSYEALFSGLEELGQVKKTLEVA